MWGRQVAIDYYPDGSISSLAQTQELISVLKDTIAMLPDWVRLTDSEIESVTQFSKTLAVILNKVDESVEVKRSTLAYLPYRLPIKEVMFIG